MKKVLAQTFFAAAFLAIPCMVGCGGKEENEVITGVTPDFVADLEAKEKSYADSMKKNGNKKPGQ